MKSITMKPKFFLIVVNPFAFNSKMEAIEFIKLVKAVFKEALIKMVGSHQTEVSFVKDQKFDLKLWGMGRKVRDQVHQVLTNFL